MKSLTLLLIALLAGCSEGVRVVAVENAINADVERVRLYGRLSALSDKKEGAISLGAQKRKEMEGDASMRGLHERDPGWVKRSD